MDKQLFLLPMLLVPCLSNAEIADLSKNIPIEIRELYAAASLVDKTQGEKARSKAKAFFKDKSAELTKASSPWLKKFIASAEADKIIGSSKLVHFIQSDPTMDKYIKKLKVEFEVYKSNHGVTPKLLDNKP